MNYQAQREPSREGRDYEESKPEETEVRVVRLRPVRDCGNLKAYVAVEIVHRGFWCLVDDCRLIQQHDKKPWVSPPQRSWTDNQGRKQYAPLLKLKRTVADRVSEAVVACWRENPSGYERAPQTRTQRPMAPSQARRPERRPDYQPPEDDVPF